MLHLCLIIFIPITIPAFSIPLCYYHEVSLPFPMSHSPVVNKNDTVYLFSGNFGNVGRNIYKWNIKRNNKWIKINTTLPYLFWSGSSKNWAMVDDMVYFIGSMVKRKLSDWMPDVFEFNFSSEIFQTSKNIKPPPIPARDSCVVTNYSHIFMFGGSRRFDTNVSDPYGTHETNAIQILDLKTYEWTVSNITLEPLNRGWYAQSCAIYEDIVYLFGGSIGHTFNEEQNYFNNINHVYKYNIKSSDIEYVTSGPLMSSQGHAVEYNGKIYWSNGVTHQSTLDGEETFYQNTVHIFDIETERIVTTHYSIDGVSGAPTVIYNNKLYIFGGYHYWGVQGLSSPPGISDKVQVLELTEFCDAL